MTALRCHRCHAYWTVHALHPDMNNISHRICPLCIPAVLPTVNLDPRKAS